MLGVTTAAVWQAREAQAQRAKAEASLQTTRHFAFFLGDLLGDALAANSNEPPAAIVSRAERMARVEFAKAPETLARVLQAVAQHHGGIGESARAAKLFEEARSLTQDRAQRDAIDCGLGMMIQRLGRLDEAATMLARVAADPSAEAESRANCASNLSTVRLNLDDIPGALQAADEAWAHWQAMPMPLHQFEGDLLVLKGSILMYTPRVAEADALFARAAALMRAQGRDQGMSYVATLNNWALGNFLAGQLQTATERHDEMLAAPSSMPAPKASRPSISSTPRLTAWSPAATARRWPSTTRRCRPRAPGRTPALPPAASAWVLWPCGATAARLSPRPGSRRDWPSP